MKAISLHQPYASLVVLGHKKIDTRGHDTNYRGEVLIHASSTKLASARLLSNFAFSTLLPRPSPGPNYGDGICKGQAHFDHLPFGAIIGRAFLCATMPVGQLVGRLGGKFTVAEGAHKGMDFLLTEKELSLGDYSYDRTAYFLASPERFIEPVPARGFSWIWDHGPG